MKNGAQLSMGEENKSWFSRNRGFVFGFAVVIAILNLAILILVPQQTPVAIDQAVMEYVCSDESSAVEHTVQLTGTLTKSVVAKPVFQGTLRISGVDALAEPVTLRLERQDGRWTGNFNDAYGQPLVWQQYGVLSIDADKNLGELLIRLMPDEAQQHFLAPGAASRTAAMTRLYTYYPSYRTK